MIQSCAKERPQHPTTTSHLVSLVPAKHRALLGNTGPWESYTQYLCRYPNYTLALKEDSLKPSTSPLSPSGAHRAR